MILFLLSRVGGTARSHGVTPSPSHSDPWGHPGTVTGLGRGEAPRVPPALCSEVLDERFVGIKFPSTLLVPLHPWICGQICAVPWLS